MISCLVTAVVISILLKLTNANSFTDALILGLLTGVGFATAIVFTTAVIPTMKKPLVFGAITGTAQALGTTIVTLNNLRNIKINNKKGRTAKMGLAKAGLTW